MNNRSIIFILIVTLAGIAVYIFKDKFTRHDAVSQPIPPTAGIVYNDRPDLALTGTDGSQLNAKALSGKSVLIFFQPDCDHCQREAEQIQQNLGAFKDYQLYFISDAALPQIAAFAQTYKLAGNPAIHFSQTSISDIMRTIGSVQLPSVYVYSNEGKLVKTFIGETPIGWILSVL